MDFYTYVQEHRAEILEKTKALLRMKSLLDSYEPESTTPFGEGIQEALEYMLELAKQDGFVVKNIQNHAAHIEHGNGDALLGVLCHLDVVPPGDGWTTNPFEPTIRDGKLYARGAMDDKGPTMAAYFALKFLKDLDVPFYKRVRIILGTDEETAWRGINRYFEFEEMPTLGFAPDASFPLIYGEKGIWTFDLQGKAASKEMVRFHAGERYNVVPDYAEVTLKEDHKEAFMTFCKHYGFKGEVDKNRYIVHGKNAHAMQPQHGVNAAFVLAKFLSDITDDPYIQFIEKHLSFDAFGEKLGIDYDDEEMKQFTINPGVFSYDEGGASIGVNCRYPKGYDLASTRKRIAELAKKHGLTLVEKSDNPVHYVDPDDPLIKHLLEAYRKVTNDYESQPFTIGGGTYARALDKAVAFGPMMPGRKDVVHQADEHIHVDDLLEATAIYMEAIYALTREDA